MPAPYLIIDLEATCWEGGKHPGENEIIEIGCAIVDSANAMLWSGGWFVRPVMNPALSEFCTKLTSITQNEVANAPLFPEAINLMKQQVEETTRTALAECFFVSWGNYDRRQFEKDCSRHQIPYPFGPHINLKVEFSHKFSIKKHGVARALAKLGLEFQGTLHRGEDDAKNIARIFTQEFGPRYPFRTISRPDN